MQSVHTIALEQKIAALIPTRDGPEAAYFKDDKKNRITYKTVRVGIRGPSTPENRAMLCDTVFEKCLAPAIRALAPGETLYWRKRPHLENYCGMTSIRMRLGANGLILPDIVDEGGVAPRELGVLTTL